MGNSKRYSEELKPSNYEICDTYRDFPELKQLIDLQKSQGSAYYLNKNKWFDDLPKFYKHKVPHPQMEKDDISISSIYVRLSKSNKAQSKIKKEGNWKNYSNKPKNTYGIDCLKENKCYFNRGHLIADAIIPYCSVFDYRKWQNFVMITDWCNRANSKKDNNFSYGMFHFEEIILNTLKRGIEIDYRVTPVFNKLGDHYEPIPRGIIIEAKTCNGSNFERFDINEFNVFIPNAQRNLKIDYKTGGVEVDSTSF